MLIANPIYDAVFKFLMEDNEVARGFLSVLLEEEIVELEMNFQEVHLPRLEDLPVLLRLDFLATIKTAAGNYKKVLIELQKAEHYLDIMRFRRYLGQQYARPDAEKVNNEKREEYGYPIITVYFLGFKLPNLESPAVKIGRVYTDLISHQEIPNVKVDFIEQLSHDVYIVQIPRLNKNVQTELERLLAVFDQSKRTEDPHILRYPIQESPTIEYKVARRLAYAVSSEEVRNEMDAYDDFFRHFGYELVDKKRKLQEYEKLIEENEKAMEEKAKVIEEKAKAIEEKDKVIVEKEKVIEENEKAIEEKAKALEEKEKTIEEKNLEIERLRLLLSKIENR